jgi:hypothetical protein
VLQNVGEFLPDFHRGEYSNHNKVYANNGQIVSRIFSEQVHAVVYFVEALCYKPKGCVIRIPMRSLIFSIYLILLAALWS